MKHPFLLFCIICMFSSLIKEVTDFMSKDKSAIIRFLGYLTVIIVAVGVFLLVLYCYFDIKLIEIF